MDIKHIYWRSQSKLYKICSQLFRWLPVKRNKIIFNNFQGRGYGDSPKYIAEEIIRRKLPYDLVWLVNDYNMDFPLGIRTVSLRSIRATYELSSAKFIVSNVKRTLPYQKKTSQYYIQTWHGSMAFKVIEKAAQEKLSPQYLKETIFDSSIIDLFLSCNSVQTKEIRDFFWFDGEIFECGSPRNDMLYKPSQYKDEVKQCMGLGSNIRIALYAPTFRDDHRTDVYNLDLYMVEKSLAARFSGEWRILVRLHPNVIEGCFNSLPSRSIDVTSYPDMQELLLISDILITDYSSTIYDALIMHKKVMLYAPDIADYKEKRGLNPIYFKLPTHVNVTNDELLDTICKFDELDYQQRLDVFLNSVHIYDDGNASKRVVDKVNEISQICNN